MNDDYIQEISTSDDFHTSTDASIAPVDYDKIEKAFYNALVEYQDNNSSATPIIESDLVEFASPCDAQLLTLKVAAAPTSSEQQATAFMADIRNLLFLFLICYFVFTVYSKLKNSVINFYSTRV